MAVRKQQADKTIFWVCLVLAAALFCGSFFCPPRGEIHPSVIKAASILLGMQALGIAGQNLANGKDIIFKKDDAELTIGDNGEEDEA